jgi:hypothetical protein
MLVLRADAGTSDRDGYGVGAWKVKRRLQKVRGREEVVSDASKKARLQDINAVPAIDDLYCRALCAFLSAFKAF